MASLASEVNALHIILPEFITASWTLPIPVSNAFVDALTAEQMVAPGQRDILKPVFAYRAPQHAQSHLQHFCVFSVQISRGGRLAYNF